MNAPKAAFADLIVLIPGQAVLLIQAKFYDTHTRFSEQGMLAELWKMGYEGPASMAHAAFANQICAFDAPPEFVEDIFLRRLVDLLGHTPDEAPNSVNATFFQGI